LFSITSDGVLLSFSTIPSAGVIPNARVFSSERRDLARIATAALGRMIPAGSARYNSTIIYIKQNNGRTALGAHPAPILPPVQLRNSTPFASQNAR